MRTLKNLAIFAAGGITALWTLAWSLNKRTEEPFEGAVIYEDDDLKITKCNTNEGKVGIASIVYKHD